jgi:hypothetical protein
MIVIEELRGADTVRHLTLAIAVCGEAAAGGQGDLVVGADGRDVAGAAFPDAPAQFRPPQTSPPLVLPVAEGAVSRAPLCAVRGG